MANAKRFVQGMNTAKLSMMACATCPVLRSCSAYCIRNCTASSAMHAVISQRVLLNETLSTVFTGSSSNFSVSSIISTKAVNCTCVISAAKLLFFFGLFDKKRVFFYNLHTLLLYFPHQCRKLHVTFRDFALSLHSLKDKLINSKP